MDGAAMPLSLHHARVPGSVCWRIFSLAALITGTRARKVTTYSGAHALAVW